MKGRNEIKEVFGKGKKYGCQGAKLFVLENDLPYNRICFSFFKAPRGSASLKSAWNAVSRNRARRLGREAFRLMKDRLVGGFDLVLLVSPVPVKEQGTLSEKSELLESLFKKAGLLK